MTLIKLNNKLISFGGKLLNIPLNGQVIYDNTPFVWYDSTDLSTITKDGNERVSQWRDKLGSDKNLIQTVGTKQPIWSSTNGIMLDNVDDNMMTLNIYSGITQPFTTFLVFANNTWKNYTNIFGFQYTMDIVQNGTPNIIRMGSTMAAGGNWENNHLLPFQTTLGNFNLVCAEYNTPNFKFTVNDITNTTTSLINNYSTFGKIQIGWDWFYGYSSKYYKEIIVFNHLISSQETIKINNYLKNKYNL